MQSGKKRTIALKKVLYCPDLPNTSRLKPKRLFSQTTAASKGNEFHYTKRGNYITMQDGEKITIRSLGNSKLYVLEMNSIPKTNKFSAALQSLALEGDKQDAAIAKIDKHFAFLSAEETKKLWHDRLGHPSNDRMNKMTKLSVEQVHG